MHNNTPVVVGNTKVKIDPKLVQKQKLRDDKLKAKHLKDKPKVTPTKKRKALKTPDRKETVRKSKQRSKKKLVVPVETENKNGDGKGATSNATAQIYGIPETDPFGKVQNWLLSNQIGKYANIYHYNKLPSAITLGNDRGDV